MSKEDFRGYLKIIAFMFVNERYEKWDKENSENKWTEQQKESVNKFLFKSDDSDDIVYHLIERIGNAKIIPKIILHKTERLLSFLAQIFDNNNENSNDPERIVKDIEIITTRACSGGKKSRKSKKSMKSKTIRKRNYSDYNNKT
jgi:hypothetical protein